MMYKVSIMGKDKLINIKEASEMLGVNPETLRRWDRAGKFKAKRHPINGYRMYQQVKIEKLKKEISGS